MTHKNKSEINWSKEQASKEMKKQLIGNTSTSNFPMEDKKHKATKQNLKEYNGKDMTKNQNAKDEHDKDEIMQYQSAS